jgi:hypothetical protein
MLRRIALLVAAVIAAVPLVAGSAQAKTGVAVYSPAEAGYAVTGGRFIYAGAHITLPKASRFAREVGRVEFGVQLWNSGRVIDLGLVACTDASCAPGGRPVARYYRPVLRIYDRQTGRLICSASYRACADSYPEGWAHASFRPGTSLDMSLYYGTTDGMIAAVVGGVSYVTFALKADITFGQARIVAEFGATPLTPAAFRAPARTIWLPWFSEPLATPFEAEVATYNGNKPGTSGCAGAPFYAHHEILLTADGTAAPARARPSGLREGGCDFSVSLAP